MKSAASATPDNGDVPSGHRAAMPSQYRWRVQSYVKVGKRGPMIANHFARLKASWSSTIEALASFLRSPRLADPSSMNARSKVATMLWLFVFSMTITAAFAFAALPLILTSELSVTGGLSRVLDKPVVTVIIAVVVLGPLIEEILFGVGYLERGRLCSALQQSLQYSI